MRPDGRGGVDDALAERRHQRGSVPAGDCGSDNSREIFAAVEDAIAGKCGEFAGERGGEFTGAAAATGNVDGESVTRRFTQTEKKRACEFPALEAPRVGSEFESVRGDPVGAAHINVKRMVAPLQGAVGNIKKPDAARATEKFARRGRKEIAAQAPDINGDLANGFAGPHLIRAPAPPSHFPT